MANKNFISFFLFLVFSFSYDNIFSQQMFYAVKGKVVDKNTKAPLAGASVFAQNTTFGEATNASGDFVLRIPNGGYSLVASFTGYETGTIRISNTSLQNDSLVFELNPAEKSLEAVTIAISNEVKDGWQKYGEFFTNNF